MIDTINRFETDVPDTMAEPENTIWDETDTEDEDNDDSDVGE